MAEELNSETQNPTIGPEGGQTPAETAEVAPSVEGGGAEQVEHRTGEHEERRGGRGGGHHGRAPREGGVEGQDEIVVRVYRCATVVKGGRRFSFGALVVVGDRHGKVGIGYGKANEVPSAVEKATKAARRAMISVKLNGTTIPHQVMGKYGASKVALIPAGEGTGVIAGASVRAVMELAGVKDVLTKCYGSTSPKNLVKAAFLALASLRSKDDVAKLRDVSIA
jgi:small subunit ribosomal protein S5